MQGPASVAPTASEEWRRNWRALVACSIGMASGYSLTHWTGSLFIRPWEQEFGWSRGEIAFAHNGAIAAALISPFAGAFLDRAGVRRPVIVAFAVMGLAYLAMTQVGGGLPQFYATYLVIQVAGIFTTGLVFTRVVATRFSASRGLALACIRIGLPLVGMVLPTILFWLIANQGWRSGFVLLAGLALLVGLPACILAIRDLPRAPNTAMNTVEQASPSFWGLLRGNHRILLLCLATAFGNAPIVAIASQFQPLMIDLGIDATKAAGLIGLLAGSVLVGTVVAGALVDRIWAPIVAFLFSVGPLIGCVILLQGQIDMTMAITATVLVGLAQGAEIDIIAYLSARYFGLRHYSTIYGCTIMAAVLAAVAGQVTIGVLYDRTGGYESALYLFIGCLVISAILFLSLGRYPADTMDNRKVLARPSLDPLEPVRAS